MKNRSIMFLRLALIAMGLLTVVLGTVLVQQVYQYWAAEYPDLAYAKYPIIVGLVTVVVVFWAALHQAFRLLDLIDRNKSFSKLSVHTLQNIKYCAFVVAALFTVGMPAIVHIAKKAEAPGVVLIFGAIFIGIPVLVAVFAGVCQQLFQNAIDIKKENDLTV
jgi:hypothetical protein